MSLGPYDKNALSDNLIKQIGNLVDGNQVKKEDVKPTENEACLFQINLEVKWTFKGYYDWNRKAGGEKSQNHFGFNRQDFDNHCQQLFNKSANDRTLRTDFLKIIANDGQHSLIYSDESHRINELGRYSVCEQCKSCYGRGNVTCSGCNGSGTNRCNGCGGGGQTTETRPVYQNGNFSHNETINVNCYSCSGSGKNTCGYCSGSGQKICSNCSGFGYFTLTYDIWVNAIPSKSLKTESPLYNSQLQDFLCHSNAAFCGSKIPFDLTKSSTTAHDTESFQYQGESVLLSQRFKLEKNNYTAVAFSNPPYTFLKPTIFDDLFADEIFDLEDVYRTNGKINKSKSRKLFAHFVKQPVLDKSLKEIVQLRKQKKQDASKDLANSSQIIVNACLGYISNKSAEVLGHSINKLLDKVSPVSSPLVWGIGGGVLVFILMLILELHAETAGLPYCAMGFIERIRADIYINNNWWDTFYAIKMQFLWLLVALSVVLVSSLIFSTISYLIIKIKQLSVPKPYRQKIRSWKPFKNYLILAILAFIGSLTYGYLASGNILPKLQIYNLVNTNQKLKVCEYLSNNKIRTSTCDAIINNFLLLDSDGHKITERKMIEGIQYYLLLKGYEVSLDSVYGPETESALLTYFHDNNIEIPPNTQSVEGYYRLLNSPQ